MTAALGDGGAQRLEGGDDDLAIGFPTTTLALVDPIGGCSMAALTVAATARCEFVLDPRRSTLDAGDEVLGRGPDPIGVDGPPAPHALRAVALEHEAQSFTAGGHRRCGHDTTIRRADSVASSR